jgi:hypothetical protein
MEVKKDMFLQNSINEDITTSKCQYIGASSILQVVTSHAKTKSLN